VSERGTNILKNVARGWTGQNRKQSERSEGHSLSRERSGRVKPGHGNKANEWGALTNCRAQRKIGQDMEIKGVSDGTYELKSTEGGTSHDHERSEQARGTHCLDSADGRISQHTERGANAGHSHSGEGGGRYK
jgi:hypothetical protein